MNRRLAGLAAMFVVLLVGVARSGPMQSAATATLQSPTPPTATFVGAQACAACHTKQHDTWINGRHSKMVRPATTSTVIGDFSQAHVTLHGNAYQLRRANGDFFITESYFTGKPQEHRVEYTLGSRRIQHYLTTVDKGLIVVLPPSWDVQRQQWFDNMDIVGPSAAAKTPVQFWNRSCVGCHVSGEEKNFKPETQEYHTSWTDTGTSCERCHGPGSAHIQKYSGQSPPTASKVSTSDPTVNRLIVRPTRLPPQTSSMICAQCHSLRNVISPGFRAGDDYFDYFTPRLEYEPGTDRELPYWPDGRPRRFSNDAMGLWQSACFRNGGATCTSCHHDPHDPDVDRNPQLSPNNNALCTQCHTSIGEQLATHTRHAVNSKGSSCVECHMPKTVISINSTMRDHTMSVPAPENTVRFNIPNACTECHTDKNAAWAVETLGKWFPGGRRARLVERAAIFTGARQVAPDALNGLIALSTDVNAGPLIQATAAGYLGRYTDGSARAALLVAARADHPAIRAAAVMSLGSLVRADDPTVRAVLVSSLSDPRRAVRIAALVSLVNTRSGRLDSSGTERFRAVGREFMALSPLNNDDGDFDRDLGIVHLLDGDFDRAADALAIGLRVNADLPSGRFLLALARLGQGKIKEAKAILEQVPSSDPAYGAARLRLQQIQ